MGSGLRYDLFRMLYNAAYRLAVASLVVCYYAIQGTLLLLAGKVKAGMRHRLGCLPQRLQDVVRGQTVVWVHASAAGEMRGACTLVKALATTIPPGVTIIVSTMNEQGMAIADRLLPNVPSLYFPLDLWPITTKVLRVLHPRVFVMVEAELWPNFLADARRLGVKTLLVNGGVEPVSRFPYHGLPACFYRHLLHGIDFYGARDELDEQTLRSWGIRPSRIRLTGNCKLADPPIIPPVEMGALRERLRLQTSQPCLVAASTHRGEEAFCLKAFGLIRQELRDAVCILAPIAVERAPGLAAEAQREGFTVCTWSALGREQGPWEVLVLDTIGDLQGLYAFATLVFVGGSLQGDLPGHNPWEPVLAGKPICYGPFMRQAGADTLEASGVAYRVSVPEDLLALMLHVRSALQPSVGQRIAKLVVGKQQAAVANAQLVLDILQADRKQIPAGAREG